MFHTTQVPNFSKSLQISPRTLFAFCNSGQCQYFHPCWYQTHWWIILLNDRFYLINSALYAAVDNFPNNNTQDKASYHRETFQDRQVRFGHGMWFEFSRRKKSKTFPGIPIAILLLTDIKHWDIKFYPENHSRSNSHEYNLILRMLNHSQEGCVGWGGCAEIIFHYSDFTMARFS